MYRDLMIFCKHTKMLVINCGVCWSRPSPLDADALVLVTLHADHDISLVQHKHLNFLGVYHLFFAYPVRHGAWSANHDLLLDFTPSLY